MIAWNWRDKNNGEPMARVTVRHYLTREEMVELLCAHVAAETGTRLSLKATLDAIRAELASAHLLDPVGLWAETFFSDAEAEARLTWARELVGRL
jgi:hypothetical protein